LQTIVLDVRDWNGPTSSPIPRQPDDDGDYNFTAHAHNSANLQEFVFEADFYSCQVRGCMVREIHKVGSENFRSDIFKNQRHMRKKNFFLYPK
jgi:hypothetical protein